MIEINDRRKWALLTVLALIVLAIVAVAIEAQRGGGLGGGRGSGRGGGGGGGLTPPPDNGNGNGNYPGNYPPPATYTSEECGSCHVSEYDRYVQSVMASAVECYDCHKIPGIMEHRMGMGSYNPTNGDCKACHAADDSYHTRHVDNVGVDCTYCHTGETIAKPDLDLPDIEDVDRRMVPVDACIVCHSNSFYYGA